MVKLVAHYAAAVLMATGMPRWGHGFGLISDGPTNRDENKGGVGAFASPERAREAERFAPGDGIAFQSAPISWPCLAATGSVSDGAMPDPWKPIIISDNYFTL
jgi:hypothetical protein